MYWDNTHEHPLLLTPRAGKHCDIVGSLIKNSKSVPTWFLSNNGCDRHDSWMVPQQCTTDKRVHTSNRECENADIYCSHTNERRSVFAIDGESGVYVERGTAGFVRLTIIMKTTPCVKLIMCKCHRSTEAVPRAKGWTGFLKSPTQPLMSSGIMAASPDCLVVQATASSACRSAWIGYCALRPVNMRVFFWAQMGKKSLWLVAQGVLVIRTGGTTSICC